MNYEEIGMKQTNVILNGVNLTFAKRFFNLLLNENTQLLNTAFPPVALFMQP